MYIDLLFFYDGLMGAGGLGTVFEIETGIRVMKGIRLKRLEFSRPMRGNV